jgi:hypothetical protein
MCRDSGLFNSPWQLLLNLQCMITIPCNSIVNFVGGNIMKYINKKVISPGWSNAYVL